MTAIADAADQVELRFRLGFGGTCEHDLTAVSGGDMDIKHLRGRKGIEHAPRGQAARVRFQLLRQRGMQTIAQEGDEDMRLDALRVLVVNRAYRQIPLEILEGLFDLDELGVPLMRLLRATHTKPKRALFNDGTSKTSVTGSLSDPPIPRREGGVHSIYTSFNQRNPARNRLQHCSQGKP